MTDKVEQRKTKMVDAAESLGISQEEYDKIVDECIFGKEEPVSDDLNDEIRKYFLSYKGYPHVMDETEREIKKAIIYFANWQKQQMIKNAISCKLCWYDGFYLDYTEEELCNVIGKRPLEVGDVLKVIIINED